jgi:hypothetical protein
MRASTFWKLVTVDEPGFLDDLIALLESNRIQYCVIGGQGVNAYAEPVVSLDLDLVIAVDQIEDFERMAAESFSVQRFPHSLNLSVAGSDLRVQVQTDPRYAGFPARASKAEILGRTFPVARIEDVFQGKLWAAMDPGRRASKRQKDLADIARLLEAKPELRSQTPPEILERLV